MPPAASSARVRPTPVAGAQSAAEDGGRLLLRVVSHELRTPLNSILGFAELLSGEIHGPLGSPQYLEYAEIIRTSGGRLLRLLNELLEIAAWQERADRVERRRVPLAAMVREVARALGENLAARHLTLSIDDEGAGVALADPRVLRRLLGGLIRHAAAVAPEGGEIRLRLIDAGGARHLVLEDEGGAVVFARLEPAILETLARSMGGGLAAEPVGAEGLRVTLSLPGA